MDRYTTPKEWLAVGCTFDNGALEHGRYIIYLVPDDVLAGIFATSIYHPSCCFEAFRSTPRPCAIVTDIDVLRLGLHGGSTLSG